ncbi:MAG TPA: tRNA uracil 4-sulfurtransferase ThiI [Nitrososphaerales archaeon]|nr:tRNA uracil 4-sulfurtransferase ThiI [Nitrososphaerales archaeon]
MRNSTMLFVAHYSEVALKGNNRPEFVRALRRGLNRTLGGLEHTVAYSQGRFIIEAAAEEKQVAERLSRVFGITWFAPVKVVPAEYPKILECVLASSTAPNSRTFRIAVRRVDKTFPIRSQELGARLGAEVVKATGKMVDLSHPDLSVHVDIVKGRALVYSAKLKGPGGLPLGTAGRVMHLFSGGIDSPVAAWLLMKRGTRPVYMHFYLAPTPQAAVESKITKLVKVLSTYEGKTTLVLVPFAEYQLATTGVPAELEPTLFRRFMRMTAEGLSHRFNAKAISTGDSLSQAASQTLWNIASFDDGSTLPILRPLLTYDKDEIIGMARRIGTFDLSLEDYKDCCAIITRHPRTRVRPEEVSEWVARLGLRDLVWRSVARASLVTYNPAGDSLKVSPLTQALPAPEVPV